MKGRQAIGRLMGLVVLLSLTGLACSLGGSNEPGPSLLITIEADETPTVPAASAWTRTPRPVATFPVPTPTTAPLPTPPPGTEGSSWQIAAIVSEGNDFNDLAFNRYGTLLAIASRDKMVRLMDPVTGEVVRTLVGHTAPVNQVVFAPDGNWLYSAAGDGTISRWEVASGERVAVLGDSTLGDVTALDVNPAGSLIVSSSGIGNVNLWEVSTGSLKQKYVGGLSKISGLSFNPNGGQFASTDQNGWIVLFPVDGTSGHEFARDPASVRDVVYSRDGRLVTANQSGVWVWDVGTGAALVLEPVPSVGAVERLAVSPDGKLLAALARSGTTWVWNLADNSLRAAIPPGETAPLSLALSPKCDACPTAPGWMLAIGGARGRVWLWGLQNPTAGE